MCEYQYKTTRILTSTFNAKGLHFLVDHPDEKSEIIHVHYPTEHGPTVDVLFISRDNDNDISVRVFGLINQVPKERWANMLLKLNEINYTYRFAKVCLDKDGDVNAEYDIPVECSDECLGLVAREIYIRVGKLIEEVYESVFRAMYEDEDQDSDNDEMYNNFFQQCIDASSFDNDDDGADSMTDDDPSFTEGEENEDQDENENQ